MNQARRAAWFVGEGTGRMVQRLRRQRCRGAFLAEAILALGIVSMTVLYAMQVQVVTARSTKFTSKDPSLMHHAGASIIEEIRGALLASAETGPTALQSIATIWNGIRRTVDTGTERYVCDVQVDKEGSPQVGDRLLRVTVTVRPANNDTVKPMLFVAYLAPPPPRQYVVYAGYLRQMGTGIPRDDAYWGEYYGAWYGLRQSEAYRDGTCDMETFPLPTEGTRAMPPPTGPLPAPWRIQE